MVPFCGHYEPTEELDVGVVDERVAGAEVNEVLQGDDDSASALQQTGETSVALQPLAAGKQISIPVVWRWLRARDDSMSVVCGARCSACWALPVAPAGKLADEHLVQMRRGWSDEESVPLEVCDCRASSELGSVPARGDRTHETRVFIALIRCNGGGTSQSGCLLELGHIKRPKKSDSIQYRRTVASSNWPILLEWLDKTFSDICAMDERLVWTSKYVPQRTRMCDFQTKITKWKGENFPSSVLP